MIAIEFDPAKDETNIAKHKVSLRLAPLVLEADPIIIEDDRFDYGETRYWAFAPSPVGCSPAYSRCAARCIGSSRCAGPTGERSMPYRKATKADTEKALREVDWAALATLSDEELTKAAETDPENPPLSDAELERLASAARVKRVRRTVGLSQPAFSERFRIPLATLRDWEHGRRVPDAATQAYLTVIEKNPEAVAAALDTA